MCSVNITIAITCIAGTDSQALYGNKLTFDTSLGSTIENIKFGPTNSKLYAWGSLSGSTNPSFIIQYK